jgi:hypothetical protein
VNIPSRPFCIQDHHLVGYIVAENELADLMGSTSVEPCVGSDQPWLNPMDSRFVFAAI